MYWESEFTWLAPTFAKIREMVVVVVDGLQLAAKAPKDRKNKCRQENKKNSKMQKALTARLTFPFFTYLSFGFSYKLLQL